MTDFLETHSALW